MLRQVFQGGTQFLLFYRLSLAENRFQFPVCLRLITGPHTDWMGYKVQPVGPVLSFQVVVYVY